MSPAKLPSATLQMVIAETKSRGWVRVHSDAEDGLHFNRRGQSMVLTFQRLRSSKFTFRALALELDLLDKHRH